MAKTHARYFILGVSIAIIAVSIVALERTKPARVSQTPRRATSETKQMESLPFSKKRSLDEKKRTYQQAPELTGIHGFVNADTLSLAKLIGKKIILVDFWTYSCINCQRTTPYLNAWYEKYKSRGLEIIGVHTPEFDFEKKLENVQTAVKKFAVRYPVALDNDYATWNAYHNRYWPRKYLIDIDGFIVYDHIGEGGYDETEKKIQELLSERMNALGEENRLSADMAAPTPEETTDFRKERSPEIYFGASRNDRLGIGRQETKGLQSLKQPQGVKKDVLYLVGDWDIQDEYAQNTSAFAKIVFRYQGKNVYFVAGSGTPLSMELLLDGQSIGVWKGADVRVEDGKSFVTIQQEGLYKLIRHEDYEEHTLELIIKQPGLQVFTFTFG